MKVNRDRVEQLGNKKVLQLTLSHFVVFSIVPLLPLFYLDSP